jgi:acyl dehydratase
VTRIAASCVMNDIYFEDVVPGAALHAGPCVIPEPELMTFAAAWDPLPIHVDRAYAMPNLIEGS